MMVRRRCSRLWGALGSRVRCKRRADYVIIKGIWKGCYICERCREELGYPLEYLQRVVPICKQEPVASRRQDT
jgi:hypothetical protein